MHVLTLRFSITTQLMVSYFGRKVSDGIDRGFEVSKSLLPSLTIPGDLPN